MVKEQVFRPEYARELLAVGIEDMAAARILTADEIEQILQTVEAAMAWCKAQTA